MLQAATDGATPSEGPSNRMFRTGNREISMREQYIADLASQMCGRLGAKLDQLNERHWNLMSRGLNEAADIVEEEIEEYHELFACAIMRRTFPAKPQTGVTPISGNPVAERDD